MKTLLLTLLFTQAAYSAVCTSESNPEKTAKLTFFPGEKVFMELQDGNTHTILVGHGHQTRIGKAYNLFNEEGVELFAQYNIDYGYPHCRHRVCSSQPVLLKKTLKIKNEYFDCL